jgi:hypothetical protein
MNNNNVKLGSIVFDKESLTWFQVNNCEVLDRINRNWDSNFSGLPITENNISLFFSDLEPCYESESIIKYKLFKNDRTVKCMATFFGLYDYKDEPHFIPFSMSPEENAIIQFGDGNDPFKRFYHLKNTKRIYVKYVHELQNIFDSLIEYNKCTKRL